MCFSKKIFYILILFYVSLVHSQQANEALQYIDSLPEDLKQQFLQDQMSATKSESIQVEDSLKQGLYEYDESIFGYEFFNKLSETKTPVLDIPLQGDYIISFNDELELLIDGSKSFLYSLRVDLSGNVNIPDLGSVSLVNLKLSDANTKLQKLVNSAYIGSTSYLSVKKPSLKKVSIIGFVNEPGTYLVNPFISLTEALKYSSGVLDGASLRSIDIRDTNGNLKEVDLYDFLVFGNRESDINLQNGDTVIVKPTSKLIEVKGHVNRPMKYEYKGEDSFNDLILFALGLKPFANEKNISINLFEGNMLTTRRASLENKLGPDIYESLYIGEVQTTKKTNAFVFGESASSGSFPYKKGAKLQTILDKIVFSENIYPFYAVLKQSSAKGLQRSFDEFSLSDPTSYDELILEDNPELYFFSREEIFNLSEINFEFEDLDENAKIDEQEFIERISEIELALNNPNIEPESPVFIALKDEKEDLLKEREETLIEKYENFKIDLGDTKDLINLNSLKSVKLGKKSFSLPLTGDIVPEAIVNYIDYNETIDPKQIIVNTVNKSEINSIVASQNLISIIYSPIQFDFFDVSITGEVKNPGIYSVTSETSIEDIYVLAGGFKNTAAFDSIIYSKQSVKNAEMEALDSASGVLLDALISQITNGTGIVSDASAIVSLIEQAKITEPSGRVTGNFSPDSEDIKNIYLDAGDSIFIPTRKTTLSVTGEVLNPTTVLFKENLSYQDYVNLAGGFSKNADKSSAFVIRANGESISLGNGLFVREIYPYPGDTVVVPRDIGVGGIALVSIASKIISDIAFSAASLNAIQN